MNTATYQVSDASSGSLTGDSLTGRLHVFVLIDALGWEVIKDRPFLNAELPFRKPVTTVLGYSSGAIPTILTGLRPAQTGHWNLLYYDPNGSPFRWLRWFSILPDRLLDNRYSRKLIKELGDQHTILLSTHILPEVEMTCDSVIIIHQGKVAVKGTLAAVRGLYDNRSLEEIFVKITGLTE